MRVQRLSYSAVMCFLRNQVDFQKRYIAKVIDDPKSPALVVGHAFHSALEAHYKGATFDEAMQAGLKEIDLVADFEIDFGKTGSRQKMIEQYSTLVNKIFEELPDYQVAAVEETFDGTIAGVPMRGIIDLIVDDGEIDLIDWKSVTSYSPEDETNYKYLLQGFIYLALYEQKSGKKIRGVVFNEVKKTINRDGTPQLRQFVFSRQDLIEYGAAAQKLITSVFEYVNNDNVKFFPNPSDLINGNQSMEVVAQSEEFEAGKIRHKTVAAPKFAPRTVTVDTAADGGSNESKILAKLAEFGIGGVIDEVITGNSVTTYKLKPNRGVKMSKIATLDDDISLALGSEAVRIIAPIYGTQTVGIEVPKDQTFPEMPVGVHDSVTNIPIGMDTYGHHVYDDITKWPHMLVGGQTGSGKSVFLHNIADQLVRYTKANLQIIDCKGIDFEDLGCEVVSDNESGVEAIKRLVDLMEYRYKNKIRRGKHHVLIIDEYADLIMSLGKETRSKQAGYYKNGQPKFKDYVVDLKVEFEKKLCRLLQKGRAANINVIIATQRPSADIVSPIIKANCPVKACLRVSTGKNSEIILDETGGERLLGKGDMLYLGSGMTKPIRLQCFAPRERSV